MANDPTLPAHPEDPIGQLPPQPWMDAPETRAVIAALTRDGAQVRFVGGCVRDSVLRRPIKDVDIATHDPPERVMTLLDAAGIHAIPTGIAHGTVTAVIGKAHYEITTLREDVETFGRHARVAYTDDWTADAARRDFTINAMFADPQGRIYDPFGGLADLGAGRVRFVGDPVRRIAEDVLRLLRFFRFHAHYGRPPMNRAALTACRRMAPRLSALSGERVAGELVRLLQAPDPAEVLIVMRAEDILQHILPEAHALDRLKVLTWLETRAMVRESVGPDPIRRLGAMVTADAAGAKAIAERLKLSNTQAVRLSAIVAPPVAITAGMDTPAVRRILRRIGPDRFRDLALVAWAGERSRANGASSDATARWMAMLDAADSWVPVALPVRGKDCLDLGLARGKAVGALLTDVERWWEDRDYRPGREECLAKLKELAGAGGG
ncbi:MAG: CCA tRNA nucleotidyltransferase [Magnetospirillum sp.]|nr:CCA tRNA nucleotidyltransferase [Magnetospirillum sp.]